MPKTAYNISLKGYVGGADFDRTTVDKNLAQNEGKRVNVLIDSLGGSLATGMSISAAFRAIDSGDVRNYIQKHYPNESFYPHNEDDD